MDNTDFTRYVLEKGIYDTARYFSELMRDERIAGNVPVIVNERPMESWFFVPCDMHGIPKIMYYEFLTFSMPKTAWTDGSDLMTVPDMAVHKKTIRIERPMRQVQMAIAGFPETFYFLWEGELMDSVEMDLAKLDVKYLQQLSQEAIKRREPMILDEVIKNKLIK